MPPTPAPVTLGEMGHWGKGSWETLKVWGIVMTVWALSTERSSRRIHRPARRGRNHNLNIWSKSRAHSLDSEGGVQGAEALLGWQVGQMLGTDPLVLEFQASVNKPFMALSVLWKVSAQVVSGRCSHTPSHHLFIESCTADRHSGSADACFPALVCLASLLSALHILRSPFGLSPFPSKQKRPPGVPMHLGAGGRGLPKPSCACPSPPALASPVTPPPFTVTSLAALSLLSWGNILGGGNPSSVPGGQQVPPHPHPHPPPGQRLLWDPGPPSRPKEKS